MTWPLCADVSPRWGMRGGRVRSSYSFSLCPDAVVSMSQYLQWAGAPGSGGVAVERVAARAWLQVPPWHSGVGQCLPGQGEGLLGPWKAAGALCWSCPPETAPPEEGPGQPRRAKTQTQQRPDTACFIARLSQPLTELGENAQIINNLTCNK